MSSRNELSSSAVTEDDPLMLQPTMSSQNHSADTGAAGDGHPRHKEAAKLVKQVTKDAKLKAKRLLRIDDTKQQIQDDQNGVPQKIDDDPGFNPSKTLNAESSTLSHIKDQLPSSFHELVHIIRHPQDASQSKAEKQVATSEEPYLSRDEDAEFLRAYKNLEEQSDLPSDEYPENGQRWDVVKKTFDDLEESRERKKVAWTLSRYVHRARVVTPEPYKFPVLSVCRWVDADGKPQGATWSQWPAQFRLLLEQGSVDAPGPTGLPAEKSTWNRDLLLQQAERVVMASGPMQKQLSCLRRLLQGENQENTLRWFAIWSAVWCSNRVFTFILCALAYAIAKRRQQPERMKTLQQSHDRIGDENATPDTFGEMINRHGDSDWFDPMIENFGPVVQPYIKELADWMEIFMNFYEWKTSRATGLILSALGFAIAMSTFLSTELIIRILTFVAIFGFFIDRPMARRFPNCYRVLAPMHWIFWDIPTHVETSFRYLRMQAEDMRKAALTTSSTEIPQKNLTQNENDPLPPSPPESPPPKIQDPTPIFATPCTYNTTPGHLILTLTTIRFMRHFPKKLLWERPLTSILELKKGDGKTAVVKKSQNFLEVVFRNESLI
jgi:hypothetical protein